MKEGFLKLQSAGRAYLAFNDRGISFVVGAFQGTYCAAERSL
jgi:hypothetical protein